MVLLRSILPALVSATLLAGCASSDRPNFRAMSEEELYAYNLDKPPLRRVYCFVRANTTSRIKHRECMTVSQYLNRNQSTLDTIITAQPAGPGIERARRY